MNKDSVSRFRGRGILWGSLARVFALGSQVVALVAMSRILEKEEFGNAMIAFATYRLLSLFAGSGLGSLVVYHVSRAGGDHAVDIRLSRSASLAALLISCCLAALTFVFAPEIAALFEKPSLAKWLQHMAPMLPFGALVLITSASLDARSRVNDSILLTEFLPNLLRLIGFPAVLLLQLPGIAVAHVLWISLALPWLWDARRLLTSHVAGMASLTRWDTRYSGWLSFYPVLGQQLQGVDILIAGYLFSSAVVADYSIAARLAVFYPFVQYIAVRSFTPRAGALFEKGDPAAIDGELAQLRRRSIVSVLVLTGMIIATAPLTLRLFGDYAGAVPMLIALAFPALFRSAFAGVDVVLRITGRAAPSTLAVGGAMIVVIAGTFAVENALGIFALPASMLLASMVFNPLMAIVARREGVTPVSIRDFLFLVMPLAGLVAGQSLGHADLAAVLAGLVLLAGAALCYFAWTSDIMEK
jgi:O-antigen/teichoic acid export membrane protein